MPAGCLGCKYTQRQIGGHARGKFTLFFPRLDSYLTLITTRPNRWYGLAVFIYSLMTSARSEKDRVARRVIEIVSS